MNTVLHDGGGPVVLDLRELAFMDVSGLRLAVRLEARAQLHGQAFSMLEGDEAGRACLRADRNAALRGLSGTS